MAGAWQRPWPNTPKLPQLHVFLELIDVVRGREGARLDLLGIGLDRLVDRGPDIGKALDELGDPRGQAEHVLQHQDLPVADWTCADPDGRNRDFPGDTG